MDDGDADRGWITQEYSKGAIYRQMLEYKRQVTTLENRLEKVLKRAVDHDDHLRIVDGWWLQVITCPARVARACANMDP